MWLLSRSDSTLCLMGGRTLTMMHSFPRDPYHPVELPITVRTTAARKTRLAVVRSVTPNITRMNRFSVHFRYAASWMAISKEPLKNSPIRNYRG